jgi:carbonic anhydrase
MESVTDDCLFQPKAVMFSCIDSRLILTRLLGSEVGDMFLVRNAGNLVPHTDKINAESISTEPGALELGCVINDIKHVIVCGHSDCKVCLLPSILRII